MHQSKSSKIDLRSQENQKSQLGRVSDTTNKIETQDNYKRTFSDLWASTLVGPTKTCFFEKAYLIITVQIFRIVFNLWDLWC